MIRSVVKYLAFVCIFCAVAGFSAYFTLSFFIQSEDTVVVPDLVDKNAIDALEMLSDLGLNTKVSAMEYSAQYARHNVIAQNPPAGQSIKANRDVSLIISKGPRAVSVPDVSGRQLAQAHITLEKKGLTVGHVAYVHDSEVAPDRVKIQHPGRQKHIQQGDAVNLLVSAGPRPGAYLMPDLRGRFLDEAIIAIEKHELTLKEFKSVYDPAKPENTVTGQAPPVGYRAGANDPVRLIINRRPGTEKAGREEKNILFSYRLPPGFLKQRVRLEMNGFGTRLVLHEGLMNPGALIWTIVPEHTQAAVFLYVNGELVESRVYN